MSQLANTANMLCLSPVEQIKTSDIRGFGFVQAGCKHAFTVTHSDVCFPDVSEEMVDIIRILVRIFFLILLVRQGVHVNVFMFFRCCIFQMIPATKGESPKPMMHSGAPCQFMTLKIALKHPTKWKYWVWSGTQASHADYKRHITVIICSTFLNTNRMCISMLCFSLSLFLSLSNVKWRTFKLKTVDSQVNPVLWGLPSNGWSIGSQLMEYFPPTREGTNK